MYGLVAYALGGLRSVADERAWLKDNDFNHFHLRKGSDRTAVAMRWV